MSTESTYIKPSDESLIEDAFKVMFADMEASPKTGDEAAVLFKDVIVQAINLGKVDIP
jgi:hypothetical protein